MSDRETNYPLYWPAGWKRTEQRNRKCAGFRRHSTVVVNTANGQAVKQEKQSVLSVADGVGRLIKSLRLMGVDEDSVIVSTNIQPTITGMPRSGASKPSDPGVAVYWRSNGQKSCMAIDQYETVADNLAAVAITLDYMRGIERHGGAEILERAFLGFQSLPPPFEGGRPWQEVLFHPDFDGDLTLERAEDSYRSLALKYHPDHGGDPQKMAELNEAIRQARTVL